MGNIVLIRFVIILYIVVSVVFVASPYIGGKNKKFGVEVKGKSKYAFNMCVMYTVTTIAMAVVFLILCISKQSNLFFNISIFLHILCMSLIYFKVRYKLKTIYDKEIFREIILNNPPENYKIKMINPCFYIIYFFPIVVNFYIGGYDSYFPKLLIIQIAIIVLSFLLNIFVSRSCFFVDDNIEKSVKSNIKYRKMLSADCFISLFAVCTSITVMNAEYKNIINIGGISEWMPFGIVVVALGILLIYSVRQNKK